MRPNVAKVRHADLGGLKPLIAASKFKPYQGYPGFSNDQLSDYFIKELSGLCRESSGNLVYSSSDKGKVIGLIAVEKLPWDTQYFGVGMAKLGYLISNASYLDHKRKLLERVLRHCPEKKIKFISAKINSRDTATIGILEDYGFRLMSTTVTYLMEKNNFVPSLQDHTSEVYKIRLYKKGDLDELLELAKESCLLSHFRMDSKLAQQKAANLYREWIKNSCRGLVDEVIIIERNNEIIGCATFEVEKKLVTLTGQRLGRTPLVVFSKKVHGTGLHNIKVLHLLFKHYFKKVEMVDTVIQLDNIKSAKYWLESGARLVECRYIFHKWL